MGSHDLAILKSPRTFLLLVGVGWALSCAPDAGDDIQRRTSAFSEAACASTSRDSFQFPNPNFTQNSPSTYNNCYKSYVVDVGTGGQPGKNGGSGGATFHHDIVAAYHGPAVTDQATCEGLYGAAYFYQELTPQTFTSLGLSTSSGVWVSARSSCVPPALSLRDFDQYLAPPRLGIMRVAATMRDPAQNVLPMTVFGIQWGVNTPLGCSNGASYMLGEQGLFKDQFMVSCDGRFRLYMQDDGNLVLAQKDASGSFSIPLWTSQTNGVYEAVLLEMQDDGNLIMLSLPGTIVWTSGTSGKPGLHLKIFNDGNMKLYDGAYGTVWQTNTGGH
jgi:hypothetical protein